jgi:hypothetical protein
MEISAKSEIADQNVDTRSQHSQLVRLSELGITSCCSSFQTELEVKEQGRLTDQLRHPKQIRWLK